MCVVELCSVCVVELCGVCVVELCGVCVVELCSVCGVELCGVCGVELCGVCGVELCSVCVHVCILCPLQCSEPVLSLQPGAQADLEAGAQRGQYHVQINKC